MGYFSWHLSYEDNRTRKGPVVSAILYFYYANEAEYDETSHSEMLRMGSTYLDPKTNKWSTRVGYSMRERESESPYFKDQSDLAIVGDFDSLEEAQSVIREKAKAYFLRMAEKVLEK